MTKEPWVRYRVETERQECRGAGYWSEHIDAADAIKCAEHVGGTAYKDTFDVDPDRWTRVEITRENDL